MKVLLAVFIGGGLGSMLRYAISFYSLKMISSGFPWGTFISNMSACLVLAGTIIFFRGQLHNIPIWRAFLITGFCGGFSTFSTFAFENFALFREGNITLAIMNILVSVLLGVLIMFVVLRNTSIYE